MRIPITDQTIEIDLDDVAYYGANGDLLAFGKMLILFCDYLKQRERDSGFTKNPHFESVFGLLIEELSPECRQSLKDIISHVEEST